MVSRTLQRLSMLSDIIVVSDDPAVEPLLSSASNARFKRAQQPANLNAALSQARRMATADAPLLIVPIDLVLLEAEDLECVLSETQGVSIVPDHAGTGTNLLCLAPAAAPEFVFAFGTGSFDRHSAEASRLGFEAQVFPSERLGLDVDTSTDLQRAGLVALGAGDLLTLPKH